LPRRLEPATAEGGVDREDLGAVDPGDGAGLGDLVAGDGEETAGGLA
jgi:hypothetical protein